MTFVRNHPGVLNRAVSLFRRHGLNIESLTVTRTTREEVSCITWTVATADVTPVVRQLEKLIDVLEVRFEGGHGESTKEASPRPAPAFSASLTQADGVA